MKKFLKSLMIGLVSLELIFAPMFAQTESAYALEVNQPRIIFETHPLKEVEYSLTREEIEMVAQVTMAEAGGEPEEAQRLVIDTILNRIDSDRFPDTLEKVIYGKNQFSVMWNGAFERCYPREDLVDLVEEELLERTNSDVLYFRASHYHDFGVPVVAYGNSYFSTY